jgi:POT family proton-dependent oligopeptide transporter
MGELQKNQTLSLGIVIVGLAAVIAAVSWFTAIQAPGDKGPTASIFIFMLFNAFFWIAFEQAGSSINVFTQQNTNRMFFGFEVPATWFQSFNAGFILLLAPIFSALWTWLGRHGRNPSQPVKIALGLIFLGVGYLFMVLAGKDAAQGAKAAMWLITMTYFWHTVGELCLSPTGLSYVTKAAPVKWVSLLMGIWFVSSFIANLGGGLVAAQVEKIENGTIQVPWDFGGKADFFFLFVISSIGAGVLILLFVPLLKKLLRNAND